jgi:hypothetical protein
MSGRRKGRKVPFLASLVRNGDHQTLKKEVTSDRHHNECMEAGYSAIHVAAELGDRESLRILVTAGVDISTYDDIGLAAIHIAAIQRRTKFLHDLLELGVDPDFPTTKGETALHFAAMYSFGSIVHMKMLVSAGADVNRRSRNRSTPLHFAARGCSSAAVRYLLEHGAKAGAVNRSKETPVSILKATEESLLEVSPYKDVTRQLKEIKECLFLLKSWAGGRREG